MKTLIKWVTTIFGRGPADALDVENRRSATPLTDTMLEIRKKDLAKRYDRELEETPESVAAMKSAIEKVVEFPEISIENIEWYEHQKAVQRASLAYEYPELFGMTPEERCEKLRKKSAAAALARTPPIPDQPEFGSIAWAKQRHAENLVASPDYPARSKVWLEDRVKELEFTRAESGVFSAIFA